MEAQALPRVKRYAGGVEELAGDKKPDCRTRKNSLAMVIEA
jgi:hypothetical protein